MSGKRKKEVHPAASAVFIILVLVGVQWAWWRFLVSRPPPSNVRSSSPPQSTGPGEVRILGRPEVTVLTIAGDRQPGDADGPPYASRYDRPTGIALDARGNLYVADTGNQKIRMISPAGDTLTVAGGEAGYADGAAAQARFNAPCGICVTPDGAVYVADTGNHAIRRIRDGQVSTVAGGPREGGAKPLGRVTGLSFSPGPNAALIVADPDGARLLQLSVDGKLLGERKMPGAPVTASTGLDSVALPAVGTLVLAGKSLKNVTFQPTEDADATAAARITVRRPVGVAPFGKNWLVTDAAHGAVLSIVNDKAQVIAGLCSSGKAVNGFRDGDGSHCLFGVLSGIVTDGKHYIYVADTGNNCIRRLDVSELGAE